MLPLSFPFTLNLLGNVFHGTRVWVWSHAIVLKWFLRTMLDIFFYYYIVPVCILHCYLFSAGPTWHWSLVWVGWCYIPFSSDLFSFHSFARALMEGVENSHDAIQVTTRESRIMVITPLPATTASTHASTSLPKECCAYIYTCTCNPSPVHVTWC